jgi:hypothetical protein
MLLGCALTASVAVASAAAADNDTLIKAIRDLCIAPHGSVDESARIAMQMPFALRDMGTEPGPPYSHSVWTALGSAGTIVAFEAWSRAAPVAKCTFFSHSDDVAALVGQLQSAWRLATPVKTSSADDEWRLTQATTVEGRAMTVDLQYGSQAKSKSASFVLTLVDVAAKVNETLLQAIRELCVAPHGGVDATASFAVRSPFHAADLGPSEGTPYAHRVTLPTLGRGRTQIMFLGEASTAPVQQCLFDTSASYDLIDLITRLSAALALPEATRDPSDPKFWRLTARSAAAGPPVAFDLTYALQGNRHLDLFHLSVTR